MEKHIALVNKTTKRVVNVLIVDNLDKDYIAQFATTECDVIAVKDSTPYVNGLWDNKEFTPPDNEYLISIGLIKEDTTENSTFLTPIEEEIEPTE
jgi:hypothetical protein